MLYVKTSGCCYVKHPHVFMRNMGMFCVFISVDNLLMKDICTIHKGYFFLSQTSINLHYSLLYFHISEKNTKFASLFEFYD